MPTDAFVGQQYINQIVGTIVAMPTETFVGQQINVPECYKLKNTDFYTKVTKCLQPPHRHSRQTSYK